MNTGARPLAAVITAVAVALAAGCADAAPGGTGSSAAVPTLPADSVAAAHTFAEGLLPGGTKMSGTVTMVGTLAGAERQRFESTLQPFEDATGITVSYTGTEDYVTVVQAGVDAGNPPDVIGVSSLAMVKQYAKGGHLVDLGSAIGADTLAANFGPSLVDGASVDGTVYGIYGTLDNFMIWYNPKNYDGPTSGTWDELTAWTRKQASAGTTPWCLGLSAGAQTGWPGAYMVLSALIKQAGPDVAAGLSTGRTAWSSPEVRHAFETIGAIATDGSMITGGPSGALSTEMGSAGNGMFTDPARCNLFEWGTYGAAILLAANPSISAGQDLDFFPVPASNPEYADVEGYAGTVFAAFSDRPEVVALMKYLSSTQAQTLTAATGNYVVPNKNVAPTAYPSDTLRKVATEMATKQLVPMPSATIAPIVRSALYKAFADYVQNPATLDAGLQSIDAAQAAAG